VRWPFRTDEGRAALDRSLPSQSVGKESDGHWWVCEHMNRGNLFATIPEVLNDELIQQLVDTEHVRIERIVSRGHSSPETGWYDQDENEWVIVLQGEALLSFEGQASLRLRKGDYINIPAHQRHKVEWTDPESETIWLAVHYRS
jgi:cupin 2 domain-containing protein